jgi:hypothetical protein
MQVSERYSTNEFEKEAQLHIQTLQLLSNHVSFQDMSIYIPFNGLYRLNYGLEYLGEKTTSVEQSVPLQVNYVKRSSFEFLN